MPYYVHEQGAEPETGTMFYTRKKAQEYRATCKSGQWITFACDAYARICWWSREQNRLDDGTYAAVPWSNEPWADYGEFETSPTSKIFRHYAHLSVEHPNLIAYTPNDEFGCEDRQLRVRPGKYLQEFAPHLDKKTIDRFCAECRKYDDSIGLKFARTPDEIVAVYEGGPSSCMSGKNRFSTNPVRAYGDSDLAIAYVGEIHKAQARAICWPEKKLYSRLYGNEHVLAIQLEKAGFTYQGNLWGARFRAIDYRDGWLMPYLDCGCSADLVYEGEKHWFKLSAHGDYDTQITDGHISDNGESEPECSTCSHCDNECEYGEEYCYECRVSRYDCAECGDEYFDRCNSTIIRTIGRCCPDCVRDLTQLCQIETCSNDWIEVQEFTNEEVTQRARDGVKDICRNCAIEFQACHSCGDYRSKDINVCDCGVGVRCSETVSLPWESDNESPF